MSAPLSGELACLSAACLWALAVTMFRGPVATHGARTVNLVKCGLATVLQGATVVALGQLGALVAAPAESLALVAFSGVIGLLIGDTALFAAVPRIGVHRTLLLQTLSPVFAAGLALAWRGEIPTASQGTGALLILAGVALVVMPERAGGAAWSTAGIALGVLAAFGQGAGVVVAKVGMEDMPALAASFLRLGTAAVGLAVVAVAGRRLGRVGTMLRDRSTLTRAVPATLLGTYLALFLMMIGVDLAPAAIAAVLLSTSPVFSLVLEAVLERRWPSLPGVVGTLLAVTGVAALTAL